MIPSNACHLRLTAAAGTELAVASSDGTVNRVPYSGTRYSSHLTAVYDPKAFILHAASHSQACTHWRRSSTAASRRSLGSVSVPVWLTTLSGQLPVKRLGGPLPRQLADRTRAPPKVPGPCGSPALLPGPSGPVSLCGISVPFGTLSPASG